MLPWCSCRSVVIISIQMAYKSPQLILNGKILKVTDTSLDEHTSFYLKIKFVHGEDWKLLSGNNEFETFESEATGEVAPIEQPFFLEYVTENVRGWPRIFVEVWQVDQHGRHNINGYGTAGIPIASGQYSLDIPCWRPKGTCALRTAVSFYCLQLIEQVWIEDGICLFSHCGIKYNWKEFLAAWCKAMK